MRRAVAVMQPYLFPYGGYFSLLQSVDHFVMFDCVQFPRRGWVHRNRVPGPSGIEEWVTLPLRRQPQDVRIRDLQFANQAEATLAERISRYPWIMRHENAGANFIRGMLLRALPTPVELLAESLRGAAHLLGLQPEFSFSSDLHLDPSLKGQDRVVAAAKAAGATHYVNASGGKMLYDLETFQRHGIGLSFMRPYVGAHWSLIYRLATEDLETLAREVAFNADRTLA